ncbi:MAG: F0F1 ATP synthase subunit alpha [Anaplasmataceae bacterium]|nr:F0F1 ATP synthase subunit alpha [Anaplasmataceae bacterium]
MSIEETTSVLINGLEEINNNINFREVGEVISVADGVAIIYGLNSAKFSEVIEFDCGIHGIVSTIKKNLVSVMILGSSSLIKEGDNVKLTGKFASIPAGEATLGRVINVLGEPIDGNGPLISKDGKPTEERLIEVDAPGIMARKSVHEPLQTGLTAIDMLIPIGRGQRELIIGDKQTGKTTIAIDAIINQANINKTVDDSEKVYSVYVAIGQRRSAIVKLVEMLKLNGAMDYTTVVIADASESAALQFFAPYAGCAIAEYYRDNGKHALIVYDDLSKHAVAYRQISLLLRLPPGREAYPGDVFYVHSRLLERAAKLSDNRGGGSLTALPIIETQAGDISAYIPTNVISITDGQIFLSKEFFNKGLCPAINIGSSVSRVGSAAQIKAAKQVAGSLKLTLAQFREIESFSQFGSDIDAATQKLLARGARLTEILKQKNGCPLMIEEQILIVFATDKGCLDEVALDDVTSVKEEYLQYMKENYTDLIQSIVKDKKINDIDELFKAVSSFKFKKD